MKILVVFDIDKTIANDAHRIPNVPISKIGLTRWLQLLMNKKKLQKDPVIAETKYIYDSIMNNDNYEKRVVFVTGRHCRYVEDTVNWLRKNNLVFDQLFMRQDNIGLKCSEVKSKPLKTLIKEYQPDIKLAFDDDEDGSMTQVYSDLGFTLYRVYRRGYGTRNESELGKELKSRSCTKSKRTN